MSTNQSAIPIVNNDPFLLLNHLICPIGEFNLADKTPDLVK